jgi:C1A family cysteine protease
MYFLLLAAIIVVASAGKLYSENEKFNREAFDEFKTSFNKKYPSVEEELQRFKIFVANLVTVDARNELERLANGTAVHGITKFSDLSAEEFKARYLTLINPKENREKTLTTAKIHNVENPTVKATGMVDWTGVYTTPIKDQGYCGSCWAFSATEQIESESMRQLSTDYILSPEQIVQCDTVSSGCSGGWPTWAMDYVKSAGGIEQNSDYPYSSYYGVTGTCSADASKNVIQVTDYTVITGSSIESSMASHVQSTGPLSICVDASSWSSYTGGVMKVCGKSIDHAVQAVGVDVSDGYWKVRNTWGTSWGESGYIYLSYGSNTCDLTYMPLYATVSKA